MNTKDVVSKFDSLINRLEQSKEKFSIHPEKDFSRNRKISFGFIVRSILSFGGSTLTNELLRMGKYSPDSPSPSAFIQQRSKISHTAFTKLFHMGNLAFDQDLRYKGYRLMAVDGSHVQVPNNPDDPDSYVKCTENERPHNEFHLNAMMDILQGIYTDAVIQKYRTQNEDRALIEMSERSQNADSIAICDRGYESYNNMAHLQICGWKYIMRIKEPGRYGIASGLQLPDCDEYDLPIHLSLTRRKNRETKELLKDRNRYRYIPGSVGFDYLPSKNKHGDPVCFFTLDFRVVRIQTGDGLYELLVTNLPASDFPTEELRKLYALRWGIETSFRDLKYIVGMLKFHSRKSDFVTQEIYANLIMYNLTQIIAGCVQVPSKKRKYEYKVRFSATVNIARSLLLKDVSPPDAETLLRRMITPVRPNRSYSRKPRTKARIQFVYRIS